MNKHTGPGLTHSEPDQGSDNERDLELLEHELNTSRRNDKRQKWGLYLLAMLLLITLAVIGWLLSRETNRADASGAQVVTEQAEKKDLAKEAQQALCGTKDTEIFDKDLCEKLALVSQEPPAPLPDSSGPSQAELVLAFRAYCDAGNCKGAEGRSPDANDIAAAFVKFCSDGACTGPEGKPGADGKPLAPEYGMVLAAVTEVCNSGVCTGAPGKDGANATQEMVLAAVNQFCVSGVCRGPAGADGQPGQNVSLVSWTDPRTGDKYTCSPNPPGSTTLTCSIEPGTVPVLPPVTGTKP